MLMVESRRPDSVVPFFDYVLRDPPRVTAVAAIARALGIGRRALEYRFKRAGLPTPVRMLAWCRVLFAADLLTNPRVSVERAAAAAGYASPAALRKAVQRLGLTVGSFRRPGDYQAAPLAFRQALESAGERPGSTAGT